MSLEPLYKVLNGNMTTLHGRAVRYGQWKGGMDGHT